MYLVPGRGGGGWKGGKDSHMNGEAMLVVSLTGLDFGFWSHFRCSGQNAIICSRDNNL